MAVNPNSKKNLKPFKKGADERRNLKGAPPKLPDLDILMAEVLGEEKDGKTAAQAILAALRAKAAKGDIRAAEVLLNRGYGLPKQKIEHSGDPDAPVNFIMDARYKDTSEDNS
jgi:hypothetical protein